jgi:hypothetical protein
LKFISKSNETGFSLQADIFLKNYPGRIHLRKIRVFTGVCDKVRETFPARFDFIELFPHLHTWKGSVLWKGIFGYGYLKS